MSRVNKGKSLLPPTQKRFVVATLERMDCVVTKRLTTSLGSTNRLGKEKEEIMKVLVETKEGEGLEALMGKEVTFFCINYIYAGKLVGINTSCVKLEDTKIVYETGNFDMGSWQDAQKLPKKYWYVCRQAITSFGEMK